MAGHRVTVYEASDRLGGRLLTHRIPEKGYITELGAMRLPLKQHPLTNIYVTERFKLKVTPFIGYDSNALFYINGYRRTFNERILPEDTGFKVYEREKNKVRPSHTTLEVGESYVSTNCRKGIINASILDGGRIVAKRNEFCHLH